MKMTIKFMYNGIKVDGTLHKGSWSKSGYVKSHMPRKVCFETVTFYSSDYKRLPNIGFEVHNNTDSMTDYFEKDRIRFEPEHERHAEAHAAYILQETRDTKRIIAKIEKRIESSKPRRYDPLHLQEAKERLEKITA